VTLRSKVDDLPLLSNRSGGMTGKRKIFYIIHILLFPLASHLCDTNGCISKDHIVLETLELNYSRKQCQGIILTIFPATAQPHIFKATPCQHGLKHPQSNGDDFMFSCRKIQFVFLDKISVDFLNKQKLQ
jgi:hypothetical protein